ncbi:hypothetical protein [Streptomyces sp. enrichment culture]|uniref:hypothetical protein n=1 Tax=Streptomyces sp. enrichment culture TaxID=1795815 RepID=UPI003F565B03
MLTTVNLSAFAMYAVVALVPLLLERGYTTSQAAWALGIGGAGQTLGRTLYAALARRTTATTRTTILIALAGLITAASAAAPGPYGLLIAVAIVAGMVRGNLTLLQATAITDPLGRHALRLTLRTPRGVGHLSGSPCTVRWRCPGRAAQRLRATVLPSGPRLCGRRAHRTVDRHRLHTPPPPPC